MVRQRSAKPLFPGSIPGAASSLRSVTDEVGAVSYVWLRHVHRVYFGGFEILVAGMAELVDARDLKSLGFFIRAGSTPALGTKVLSAPKCPRHQSALYGLRLATPRLRTGHPECDA